MKKIIMYCILGLAFFVLLLAVRPRPDARVEFLEKRLTALEYQVSMLEGNVTFVSTNIAAKVDVAAFMQGLVMTQMDRVLDSLSNHIESCEKLMAANRVPVRLAAPSGPLRLTNGVPVAVYQQLLAAAQREWPGNFRMQDHEVRDQIESYLKLHSPRP